MVQISMATESLQPGQDIVRLVAQFVQPNPVVYTSLAMVNKAFHDVFTSDEYWKALDAYRKRTNIFQHFIKALPSFERLMVALWDSMPFLDHFGIEKVNNKYVQLGYYTKCAPFQMNCNRDVSNTDLYSTSVFTSDKWMLKLLIKLKPRIFMVLNKKSRDNEDLVYLACTKKFELIAFVSERILRDKRLIYRIIDAAESLDVLRMISFLKTKDSDLVIYALKAHHLPIPGVSTPSSIAKAPELFRNDKEAILNALNHITMELYLTWYQSEKIKNRAIFSDPDIIAAIVDNGFIRVPDENYSRFAGINKLICLCDDYDWMAERIKTGPGSWTLASDRLQEDRRLLILALETTNCLIDAPEGLVKRKRLLMVEQIPDIFINDDEVIQQAFKVYGLGVVPVSKRTKAMVREHTKTYGAIVGILNPREDSYELTREAILSDARHVTRARCDLARVSRDPILRPVLEKNIHLIGWELFSVSMCVVFTYLYGDRPFMENMDRWSSIQLLKNYPEDFAQSDFPWAYDVEIVVEAVRGDRCVFGYLPKSLQNNKRVQKSLGPKQRNKPCQVPRFHF